MIGTWQRRTKQKVSQAFARVNEISFRPLNASNIANAPLTIEINVSGQDIHRMYVDGGSFAEILYEHCFERLRADIKKQLIPVTTPLTGISGEVICPLGKIRLWVTIGDDEHATTASITSW